MDSKKDLRKSYANKKKRRKRLIIGIVVLTLMPFVAYIKYKINHSTNSTSTNTYQNNSETIEINKSAPAYQLGGSIQKGKDFYNDITKRLSLLGATPINFILGNPRMATFLISNKDFGDYTNWILISLENYYNDKFEYGKDKKNIPGLNIKNIITRFINLAKYINIYSKIADKVLLDTNDQYKNERDLKIRVVVGNLLFMRMTSNTLKMFKIWENEIIRIYDQYINSKRLNKLIFDYLDKMIDLIKDTYSKEPKTILVGDIETKLKLIENYNKFKKLIYYTKYIIFFTIFKMDDNLKMLGLSYFFEDEFKQYFTSLGEYTKEECKNAMLK
eukprot:GAHX01002883.1.p1 GENE.GAHX01002883.1~~GAHX01002883.1.p1  ORF type:complete len:330 (-),score=57.32 GAHX01002883.1:141-1130(-)